MKTLVCRASAFGLFWLAQALVPAPVLFAQETTGTAKPAATTNRDDLQRRVSELETQVAELRKVVAELQSARGGSAGDALLPAPVCPRPPATLLLRARRRPMLEAP